ncbi:hypothetical protein ACFLZW_07875 [Chloroflexota bacterium]
MSPIRGLTDRGLRFPEIGHIRKGTTVEKTRSNGSTYKVPVDLDYFRVEFDEQEQETADLFRRIYKDEPQEIRIVLPFNDIDRMWEAWLEAYTAGRMMARSDGEFVRYRVDSKTGVMVVKNGINIKTGNPEPHPNNDIAGYDYKNKAVEYSAVGRLKVFIRELNRAAYMTVHTTSMHDIANISDQLRAFLELNGGQISGIPLVLRRRPKMISTPGKDGKRVRREKWLLSIEADPTWVSAKLTEINRLALPANGDEMANDLPQLPEPKEPIEDGNFMETIEPSPQPASPQPQPVGQDSNPDESPDPEPTNGSGERPYTPAQVQARLGELGRKLLENGDTLGERDRNMIAVNLEKCFAGETDSTDMRKTVMNWLCGIRSVKDLTVSQALALKKWLNAQPDDGGEWHPEGMAAQEANAVFKLALEEEGQLAMEI